MDDSRKTKTQLLQALAELRRQVAARAAPQSGTLPAGGTVSAALAEVFEAIPLPATLIDPQGTILEVNRAFLEHARRLGRNLRKEDRRGHSIYEFAHTEEARAHLAALIQPVVRGERSHCSRVSGYAEAQGRRSYEQLHASAIPDAAGRVVALLLLRENVTAQVRKEERRQALLRIREAIWGMIGSTDLEHLLLAVREGLEGLGVPFQNCGVNLVDTRSDPPTVRFHDLRQAGYGVHAEPDHPAVGTIIRFWRDQQVVYRKDLNAEDVYGERASIRQDHLSPVRAVVDVPFSHGTLAVNSPEPAAFSAEDLEILQEMAQGLSEGFQRLEELESMARRAREAEALVQATSAVAGAEELDEALQRVVREAGRLMSARLATLFLYDEQEGVLVPRAQVGHDGEVYRHLRLRPGEGVAGHVFATGKPRLVARMPDPEIRPLSPEAETIMQQSVRGRRFQGRAAVPLVWRGRVIGTLSIAEAEQDVDPRGLELLRVFGEQAVLAIERMRQIAEVTQEVARRTQAEEIVTVNLALQRVRNEILQMETQQDWEKVALACRRELDSLVSFAGCSIVLVDRQQGTGVAYYCPGPGEVVVRSYATIHPLLLHTVESQTWAYRRTRAQIDQGEERISPHIRSVIDVPFAAGTLAVNSTVEEAFDQRAIQLLAQFAQVLSEGCRRLQDLQALEAERRQAEEQLKLSLALQQVRNAILRMQSEEDWQHLVEVVQAQLQQLLPFNACSINLVDWATGESRVHYRQQNGTRLTVRPGLPPAFRQARETGEPVYRRTQAQMYQYQDRVELFEQQVHSVVDVPFTGGTLALNSREEAAFSPRDLDLLAQFAQVLSEAHRRLQDLQALEEKETQLRQAQKLEAVGHLAGGVAHDFNNLLTIISGYSEFLLRHAGPDQPLHPSVQEIQKAADRGAGLVRQLLAFSRKQMLQPSVLNLNLVVADLGKMLQRLIGEDIELKLIAAPALGAVQADRGQVEQVLLNLVVNARDAMPQGGKLFIETANVEVDESDTLRRPMVEPGAYVRLSVSDTGVGMDKETQAQIFEPFFTTKEPGKGTGLGLAMVYGIVKQSGGYIWVYSEPGQGTTFKIYLPRIAEPHPPAAGVETARRPLGGQETILLVEDEEAVRRLMALSLREQGYTLLEAGGGEEALQVGSQHAGLIHLLVTDVVMPGMNGQQLAERLAGAQPQLKVLYMSGYTEGIIAQHGILAPQVAFLQKPFSPDRLALRVREVLDSPPEG
jgi:PAS domain S-box-containing protein